MKTGPAGVAFVNSQVAAAMAMVTWMLLDYLFGSKRKWNGMKMAEGCVIGLATVTPAAGFIHLYSALAFGLFGALIVFVACQIKHKKFGGTDDSLDVFCCHGVGGAVGIFMLGLFASHQVNPSGNDGAFFGNDRQLGVQLLGIVVVAAHSMIITFVILWVMKKFLNITVDMASEADSIDLIEHGQNGYVYDPLPASTAPILVGEVPSIVTTDAPKSPKSPKKSKKEVSKEKMELEMDEVKE